jgi:copper chaperone NosL
MYPHKLAGQVDIINGLNHYIGMKILHTKDFVEFTVLPFIIVFFALICFAVALLNRKKWLIIVTSLFILFGVVAMADFWRWEYNYGHNLNPEAAIRIPGMAYQPPLIGYKQLLNFGAYSVPDIGGYLFIMAGLLLVLCIIIQSRHEKK